MQAVRNSSSALCRHLARFARDESGVVVVEMMIYLPLLLWAWLAMFAFWDAYREINIAQKATYSISDMLSREQTAVNDTYRNGLRNVFAYMNGTTNDHVKVRFTSITYKVTNKVGAFKVDWSYSPGSALPKLTTTTLQAQFKDDIPIMSDGDYVLMIETTVDYDPVIDVPSVTFDEISNRVITRPRFMRVCESGQTCT
ncbi:MAG: hypothetical protein QM656_02135 [Paracoccaceae bacterium]